ncbi:glycoside hydrolase family 15 protein [Deinococcus irradiatisoli]|uniref:Glycoside hydrolase family 15 protein n=1 Tax=Deinococcus irradiatisoli TaxID=2202254 RepID=A0A2Z3JIH6_9DEIO|nr:glycoside hydrolase family 15 protein [Deinococcus irradiatisoli]AWN22769.1 glycoside hydrolase family 15 protein [Deinococcus irradiatisoli]
MNPPQQLRLEDYGVIGDLVTSALIGADGSVGWLCLPRLDSPSLFGALLDEDAGFWRLCPEGASLGQQHYWPESNVLDTAFRHQGGEVLVTDFMPLGEDALPGVRLVRRVRAQEKEAALRSDFVPRLDYGAATTLRRAGERLEFGAETQRWQLWSSPNAPHDLGPGGHSAQGRFTLQPGEEAWFALLDRPEVPGLSPQVLAAQLSHTDQAWTRWLAAGQSRRTLGEHPYRDLEIRSALALKLLSAPNGAIAAAATTSLPEVLGGERNWDYRYCWLRDSSFTAQALHHLGHRQEAADLLEWFKKATRHSDAKHLKIAYTIAGEEVPAERTLPLSGYRGSRPVRVGNGARDQRQLDVYGEVISAYFDSVRYRQAPIRGGEWQEVCELAEAVCELWPQPDKGIWEARRPGEHHTYSKLMCWVALDRAVKLGHDAGKDLPPRWAGERDKIREALLTQGFNKDLNSFTQTFGGHTLDATSLLIPMMEFLPPDDSRVLGTLQAVRSRLADGALVRRYQTEDGLSGEEGYFVLCSFWLISAEALCGELDAAKAHLDGLLRRVSPLGLWAEEITPDGEHLIGNLPQAYSHVGLINALAYLQQAQHKFEQDDQPDLNGSGAGTALNPGKERSR